MDLRVSPCKMCSTENGKKCLPVWSFLLKLKIFYEFSLPTGEILFSSCLFISSSSRNVEEVCREDSVLSSLSFL